MQPQLTGLIRLVESTASRLHRLTDGLPDDLWARRPASDSWSIAECVSHLNLTGAGTMPRLRSAVSQAGVQTVPGRKLHQNLTGFVFAIVVGPTLEVGSRRFGRVRAPAAIVPQANAPRGDTMATFDRLQRDLITLIAEADGRAIDDVVIASPFVPRLKYNVYSALRAVARHELRHVVQAERARRSL